MCVAGVFLAYDAFAAQFLLCLRDAEQVGGKLGAPHVVEHVGFGGQVLVLPDLVNATASIKALIASDGLPDSMA
ncbi:hypothetical protein [Sphingobium baderi]|uniref:Uncharacterized protein n=1 Tax=Sphingobium baderi LL03 TaxID=1114964 RepID=T0GB90_9SPHN|nr:hypothetical protein [Sphingobium baderi]EQB01051.1 hypothetical protein L485_11345 [Sphingobium baderi LL03]KMS61045.1 hypothetical protein V475_16020 [Sphingobium baderi LL03]